MFSAIMILECITKLKFSDKKSHSYTKRLLQEYGKLDFQHRC